jgi:hypothetical protein
VVVLGPVGNEGIEVSPEVGVLQFELEVGDGERAGVFVWSVGSEAGQNIVSWDGEAGQCEPKVKKVAALRSRERGSSVGLYFGVDYHLPARVGFASAWPGW